MQERSDHNSTLLIFALRMAETLSERQYIGQLVLFIKITHF
jgi:hypothetical protein